MIQFNPELFHIEEKLVKSISGSGILIYEENGRNKKVKLGPFAANAFKTAVATKDGEKQSSFLSFFTPQKMLLVFYDKTFIGFDYVHIGRKMFFDNIWGTNNEVGTEDSLKRYKTYYTIKSFIENKDYFQNDWYFDGNFFFHLTEKKKKQLLDEDSKEGFMNVSGFNFYSIISGRLITENQKETIKKSGSAAELLNAFTYQHLFEEKKGEIDFNSLSEKEKQKLEKKIKKENDLNFIYKSKCRSFHYVKFKNEIAISPTSSYFLKKDNRKEMEIISQHYFINIYFFRILIRTIGDLYGVDKIKQLNVRKILTEMNLVSFANLPIQTQKSKPVNISYGFIYFWILGFYHRENDLNKKKKLGNLFNKMQSNEIHKKDAKPVIFNIVESYKKKEAKANVSNSQIIKELRELTNNELLNN